MLSSRHFGCRSIARAVLIAALTGLGAVAPAPASAQSLLELFFNGARRPSPPPTASAYADPQIDPMPARPSDPGPRIETGPAVSYCVRLCDGRFFPIQRTSATPVEVCNSFCPAAKSKVFSGSAIDHAVAHDGQRYADLANAFVYRTKVVPGCSCNGKDAFGLVNMKAAEDPTLRNGDVVATDGGFVAYNGNHKKTADNFTPVNSASGVPAEARRESARTRIVPAGNATATAAASFSGASSGRDGNDWQAQLVR